MWLISGFIKDFLPLSILFHYPDRRMKDNKLYLGVLWTLQSAFCRVFWFMLTGWIRRRTLRNMDLFLLDFRKSVWMLFAKAEIHEQPSYFHSVAHGTISLEEMYYFSGPILVFYQITAAQLFWVWNSLLKWWQNCDNCSVSLGWHNPTGLYGCLAE